MDAAKVPITNPQLRLMNMVCSCLINEPKFYQSADARKEQILELASAIAQTEPEFILKLALYVRDDLNIRSTANFLAAVACNSPACHPFLLKYFPLLLRLPTDLLEMVDFFFALPESARYLNSQSLPAAVRKAVKDKFASFDVYALGKYNRERAIKKAAKKAKAAKANPVPIARPVLKKGRGKAGKPNKQCAAAAPEEAASAARKITLKQLIRKVHIAKPAENVMSIVGKRYPATEEDFKRTGLHGAFDPKRAGLRMKLPTPETWETAVSAMGNKAETWETLLDRKKLPFMAMLRNLRNMLLTGVSEAHHAQILARLTDEKTIAASRQLPWRFLSAYDAINIDVEKLLNDILDHDGSGEKLIEVKVKGKKGAKMGAQRTIKKRVIIPKCVPDLPLIARYRSAIDTAIRLSTLHNLAPIRGHTVVFVDVSGSMSCPCSTKGNMSSVQTVKDVAILLGLMLQSVCESCDFRLFSSPTPRSQNRPDVPVPLKDDVLLENIKRVTQAAGLLGGGTDFPAEYVAEMTKKRTHIDNFIILSDMMIAPGRQEMAMRGHTVSSLIGAYRRSVNANMLFVAIDLFGAGKSLVACEEGGSPNDVLITGFSDHVLRFIAERGNDKQLEYVRNIDKSKKIGEHKPVRPAAAGPAPAIAAVPDALMADA